MSNPLIQIPNKGDGSFGEGDQSLNKVGASYLKDASCSESLTVKSNNVISNQKINDEYLLKMDNTINQITNQKVQMVSQLQKIIKEIYHQLDQKNTTISRLEGITKQQANNLQQQQAKIVELRNQNQRKSDELVKSNQRHNQLLKQNQKKVSQLLQLQKKVAELQTQNYQLIHQTGGKFGKFLQLDEITKKLEKTVNNSFEGIIGKLKILSSQNASLNVQLSDKSDQITQLKEELQKRSAELSDKNVQVTQLEGVLQTRKNQMTQVTAELQEKSRQMMQLQLQQQNKSKEIIQLNYQLSDLQQKLHSHQLQLQQTQKHVNYFISTIIASRKQQFIIRFLMLQLQSGSIQRLSSLYKLIQDYNNSLVQNNDSLLSQISHLFSKLFKNFNIFYRYPQILQFYSCILLMYIIDCILFTQANIDLLNKVLHFTLDDVIFTHFGNNITNDWLYPVCRAVFVYNRCIQICQQNWHFNKLHIDILIGKIEYALVVIILNQINLVEQQLPIQINQSFSRANLRRIERLLFLDQRDHPQINSKNKSIYFRRNSLIKLRIWSQHQNYPKFQYPYVYMQNIKVSSQQLQTDQSFTIKIQFLNKTFLLQNQCQSRQTHASQFFNIFLNNDHINATIKYTPEKNNQSIVPKEFRIQPIYAKQQY